MCENPLTHRRQSALQQAQQCSELMVHFGYSSLDPDLQLTREFICQEYSRASMEWSHFVAGLDSSTSKVIHLSPGRDEFFWLDEATSNQPVRSVKLNSDQLYRCSWCRMPSAQLRRCTGCRAEL